MSEEALSQFTKRRTIVQKEEHQRPQLLKRLITINLDLQNCTSLMLDLGPEKPTLDVTTWLAPKSSPMA